jgi:2-polyprenyl-3-methyl-5-hydroxy-6-metoxy-1,4-benzoquinol methylase
MTSFAQLHERLLARYPNYAGLWQSSRSAFGSAWEHELSRHIGNVFGPTPGDTWDEAVDGYAEFCTEALRAQVFFERTGRYRATSYADTLRDCYRSSDYMERRYLPGQYLSHFVWPHHYRMLRGFLSLLSEHVDRLATFYEVGVGCGMYSQKVLDTFPSARGTGIDISEYALRFTARVVRAAGHGARYQIDERDIFADPLPPPADLVICQEVLEHLEAPDRFVARLTKLVRPGGWGYITAAINAAHTDHIYLYRSPDEVRRHVEEAGWRVVAEQIESAHPEKPPQFRPTIAGYLARNAS